MTKVLLILSYDGTDYAGWQRQPANCGFTVQQMLEDAIGSLLGEKVVVHGSGRTDAGVHALAQCCHFILNKPLPVEKLPQILNHHLPPTIRISRAQVVSDDFHARFSVRSKHYRYTLERNAQPSAFSGRFSWQIGEELDIAKMREAAGLLTGCHDFRNFTVSGVSARSFVREITRLEITEPLSQPCTVPWLELSRPVLIDVEGSGFLYKMVRIITARLVAVGRGQIAPHDILGYLDGSFQLNLPPAPARGLMMVKVQY